jgi:uncharacterized membrane protein
VVRLPEGRMVALATALARYTGALASIQLAGEQTNTMVINSRCMDGVSSSGYGSRR